MSFYSARKITTLSFLTLGIILCSNCKKPEVAKPHELHKLTTNAGIVKEFSIDDLMQQIPQTVMYNLGEDAQFYTERAEKFTREDGTTVVRFPISETGKKYLYAIMYPGHDQYYMYIRFTFDERGDLNEGTYGAKDAILDLNNWVIYQQEFESNQVSKRYVPIRYAEAYWEEDALANGLLQFDESGQIDAVEGDYNEIQMRPGYPNCGWVRSGNGTLLGNLIRGIGNWFRTTAESLGPWTSGDGSGSGSGGGWGGSGIGPGADEGGGGAGGNNGWPELPSGGGSGGGSNPNPNPNPDPNGVFDGFDIAPGAANYTQAPATVETLEPRNFRDQNGYLITRKAALQVYVSEKPYGLIDCEDIAAFEIHFPAFRNIASYTPPQSVQNHINDIINANTIVYNSGNTFIQKIQDGRGVVNLDLFSVDIQQLPKNGNGVMMTPLEFLEYFRKNLSHPILPSGGASFEPYNHYVAGSINIDETNRFNSNDVNALGSLVHIDMVNDGTVILSDYYINNVTESYWFTFSTMKTPWGMDGFHPVAGNRRFGIQKKLGGGWHFYIAGADRAWNLAVAIGNQNYTPWWNYFGFHDADVIWEAVQNSVINYVNNNQGQASFFPTHHYALRANWLQIGNYLMGNISLDQFKAQLGCP